MFGIYGYALKPRLDWLYIHPVQPSRSNTVLNSKYYILTHTVSGVKIIQWTEWLLTADNSCNYLILPILSGLNYFGFVHGWGSWLGAATGTSYYFIYPWHPSHPTDSLQLGHSAPTPPLSPLFFIPTTLVYPYN